MYTSGFLRDANLSFHVDTAFKPAAASWSKAVDDVISSTSLDEQAVTGIITQKKTWQAIAIQSLAIGGAKPITIENVTIVTTDGTVHTAAVGATISPSGAVIVELPAPMTIQSFKFKLGAQRGPGKLTIWVAPDILSTHPAPVVAPTPPPAPASTIAPGEPSPASLPVTEDSWIQRNWVGVAISVGIIGFLAYKKWRH